MHLNEMEWQVMGHLGLMGPPPTAQSRLRGLHPNQNQDSRNQCESRHQRRRQR
jgi:hypothetical protein